MYFSAKSALSVDKHLIKPDFSTQTALFVEMSGYKRESRMCGHRWRHIFKHLNL